MVQIRGGGAFECRGVGHGGAAAAAQAAAKAAAAAAEAASSLQTLHSQHEGANDFYLTFTVHFAGSADLEIGVQVKQTFGCVSKRQTVKNLRGPFFCMAS
jgi:hypothetical protein